MNILLFGGTTEGRLLARAITELGHRVTVSVATSVGREGLEGLDVRIGRLEAEEMTGLVRNYDLCVDATHPYAQIARKTIQTACIRAGVPLRRVARQGSSGEGCLAFPDARAAAEYLRGKEGNVLLTAGAKELEAFRDLDPARLYARVLPTPESLAACEAACLPHRNILALWGPFSTELNAALIRQYGIRWLVTKDGGRAGGFEEKVLAARETGAEVLLIRRPEDAGLSAMELLEEIGEGEGP